MKLLRCFRQTALTVGMSLAMVAPSQAALFQLDTEYSPVSMFGSAYGLSTLPSSNLFLSVQFDSSLANFFDGNVFEVPFDIVSFSTGIAGADAPYLITWQSSLTYDMSLGQVVRLHVNMADGPSVGPDGYRWVYFSQYALEVRVHDDFSSYIDYALVGSSWNGTVPTPMDFTISTPVPEPETYAMLLSGLGLLGFAARRRKLKEVAAV